MGEATEGRRKGIDSFSIQAENYPRDLLQRFIFSSRQKSEFVEVKEDGESEDVELNLGLSLGGRFGVDKNSKKLIRSSSIAGTISITRGDEASNPPALAFPALIRSSSLPTETEEEWRKRKELQCLRRMEAKRRRSEKQRSKESVGVVSGGCLAEERREISGEIDFGGGEPAGRPISQGSAELQGGSWSGMSEFESKPFQGSSSYGEARIATSNPMLQEQGDEEAGGGGSSKTKTNQYSPNSVNSRGRGRESGTNSKEDMPCVFTVGDGPNGRRVEGILYKYGKGEEVRIMCVCHGSFLSPAEFVKHAGGRDVDNPLRHIVVNPNPTSFL